MTTLLPLLIYIDVSTNTEEQREGNDKKTCAHSLISSLHSFYIKLMHLYRITYSATSKY